MPRLLALEWDHKEARVVIARTRGKVVAVEHALAVPLPLREGTAASEADIGAALAKVLADHGAGRLETLVAVGRSNIELKFLSTPPAPPEELPDLVRFQAMRQFTSLGDEWPLDFVPLSPNADGGSNVLAAAISPDLVQQIRQTCTAASVSLSRLVLRPFAAASLIKGEAADDKCRMVVDLLGDDADLTVLIGEQVIFPRTVRLPAAAEPENLARALLVEGRRTIIAAQNQLGGRRVEEVVIFGDGLHHSSVKQLLEKELSLPVKLIDPFDKIEWAEASRARKPEFPGTFAPLLGMLLDEASGAAHAIDFLHVRKRPVPANRRRTLLAAGIAAAAVLLLGLFAIQWQLWSLDDQIRALQSRRNEQEKLAKAGAKPLADAAKLDLFARGELIWLDELSLASENFPAAGTAQVDNLTAQFVPREGGKFTLSGLADSDETATLVNERLRVGARTVTSTGAQEDKTAVGGLKWRFKETVTVPPHEDIPPPAPPAKGKPQAKASVKGGKP
jgi:Tfp pilus assembly PilM family ATPase